MIREFRLNDIYNGLIINFQFRSLEELLKN